MTYVLILLFITGTPRVATSSADFTTKERCEAAGRAVTERFDKRLASISFVCVEK